MYLKCVMKVDTTGGKKHKKSVEEGREVSEDRVNPGQDCDGSVNRSPTVNCV